jgi:hypothetical protein
MEPELRRMVVYVIRGPNGAYVGETIEAKKRWWTHKGIARGASPQSRPLYVWMRRHGVEAFSFEVVATCVTPCGPGGWSDDARAVEKTVIRQLEADGVRLLNAQCTSNPCKIDDLINS